jgi:hypothetical protein
MAVALSCHASSNDLKQAILSFPKISAWEFRPDEAVRSANMLISAGRDSACTELEKVAKAKRDVSEDYEADQKVCHLCRLVFMPKNLAHDPLRGPMLGAPGLLPLDSMKDSDWPDMPFAIVNDVPLSMTSGYKLDGFPEPAEDYLAYCSSNGVFRTMLFPVPTANTASNSLNIILESPAWKSLKWYDPDATKSLTAAERYAKETLWKQVENMTNKTVP